MVHSSLSQLGWTVGGPVTVVRALIEVLEPLGTLVMPAETPYMLDPSTGSDPRVKAEWHDTIRAHLAVFDPLTSASTMGAIAEAFRTYPGTLRSQSPYISVCANGHLAKDIIEEHALEFGEGRSTPFEKLYNLGAYTLLLGVGFNRCTSLHYAESLVPTRRTTINRFPVIQNGERVWIEAAGMANDNGDLFPEAGKQFAHHHTVISQKVGNAQALFFSTRELVDFSEGYFTRVLPQVPE